MNKTTRPQNAVLTLVSICSILVIGICTWAVAKHSLSLISHPHPSSKTCSVYYESLENLSPRSTDLPRDLEDFNWQSGNALSEILDDIESIIPNYGGVWPSDNYDKVIVGIVEYSYGAAESKQTILDVVDDIGRSGQVDFAAVKYSATSLNQALANINVISRAHLNRTNDWPISATHIDFPRNKVVISIPSQENEIHITPTHCHVLTEITELYSDQVIYQTYDAYAMAL